MIFLELTKEMLEGIMEDLEDEGDNYEWGTDEYEFLMEIIAEIEDEVRK